MMISSANTSHRRTEALPAAPASSPWFDRGLFGSAWHAQTMKSLNDWEIKIDEKIPNNGIQKAADCFANAFGKSLEQMQAYVVKEFAPLARFNQLLEKYDQGCWYEQFASYLIQLPFKAARNIIRALYQALETILYGCVHPIKGASHLIKLLATLAHELTIAHNWPKMGMGMVGANLGLAALGNPFSTVGIAIGLALAGSGMLLHLGLSLYEAENGEGWRAAKESLIFNIKALPEALLTGFGMGLLIGAIQRAILKQQQKAYAKFEFESRAYADQFIKENNLPNYTKTYVKNGKICLEWSGKEYELLRQARPDLPSIPGGWYEECRWHDADFILEEYEPYKRVHEAHFDLNNHVRIDLHPSDSTISIPKLDFYPHFGDYARSYKTQMPLASAGMHAVSPPHIPLPPTLAGGSLPATAVGALASKNISSIEALR